MTAAKMFPPFEPDVRNHVMEIIRDDGLYRHIRFRRPGTMCMHFDLITWPGHLCYTGDMGSYLFTRLTDMFEFFRGYAPNPSYWSEKVLATDKTDGIKQWSEEVFRASIKENFEQRTEDMEPMRRDALWEEIEDNIFGECENGEPFARAALYNFNFDGFCFSDSWEWSFSEWSHRFLWCCHAIPWGIDLYDAHKRQEAEAIEARNRDGREAFS